MFKDDFKKANDSIHADEELINKVLALQDQGSYTRRKRVTSYIPAAAAAAVILSVSAAALPFMLERHDDGVISSETISGTAEPGISIASKGSAEEGSSAVPPERSSTENNNDTPQAESGSQARSMTEKNDNTAQSASSSASNSSQARSTIEKKDNTAQSASSSVSNGSQAAINTPVPVPTQPTEYSSQAARGSSPASDGDAYSVPRSYTLDTADNVGHSSQAAVTAVPDTAPVISSSVETVVLSMNSGAYEPNISESAYDGYASLGELSDTQWTYRDYFDYLGKTPDLSLPEDMRLIGHASDSLSSDEFLSEEFTMFTDEYGVPAFDNRIFAFEGSGDRYMSLQTTKDTSVAQIYLTDSNFTLSKIGRSYAVLIGSVEDCRGYMICNSVAYVINAHGLNETELKALLLSVSE
jgi:hypothetical protein